MYKVLIAGAVALATMSAQAHGPHGPYVYYEHRHYDRGSDWIAPAILGGLVVYAATRPPVVVAAPQPVIVTPTCGPWVEIRSADGTVTQTRTCQ